MEEAVILFNSKLNNLALNLYLHGCGSAIHLKGFGNLEEDGGRRVMFGLSERIIAFIYLNGPTSSLFIWAVQLDRRTQSLPIG